MSTGHIGKRGDFIILKKLFFQSLERFNPARDTGPTCATIGMYEIPPSCSELVVTFPLSHIAKDRKILERRFCRRKRPLNHFRSRNSRKLCFTYESTFTWLFRAQILRSLATFNLQWRHHSRSAKCYLPNSYAWRVYVKADATNVSIECEWTSSQLCFCHNLTGYILAYFTKLETRGKELFAA